LFSLKPQAEKMLPVKIVGLLSLAFAVSQFALSQAATQAGQYHHWPNIDLNVLVSDKSGHPQASLDKSAFHIFENGAERPIESVTAVDAPISLALLIDTSGSTYGNRDTIRAVATAVIRSLPSGSEVMAVLFADKPYIDLPFTQAESAPLTFLNLLDSRGPTAFYDALVATEDYIAVKAQNPKRALVVLSDGEDNHSTLSLQQTLNRIEEKRDAPTIYFTEMPNSRAKGSEKRHSQRVANLVISVCGGFAIIPDKNEDVIALSDHIAALIRSQCVLTFTAAGTAPDPRFRKLGVRMDRSNLEAHAVQGYFGLTQ
jgi:Ca-activated chloride channel homolog